MQEIIEEVEKNPEYHTRITADLNDIPEEEVSSDAIDAAGALLSSKLESPVIAVGTVTGRTARILSSYRPSSKIVAVTHDLQTYNQLALVWGVSSYILKPVSSYKDFVQDIVELISEKKLAKKGDHVVIITGSTIGTPGATDTIKIASI